MKKSSQYKQNYSGNRSQWKKYVLIVAGAFFGGVLLSTGGYHFFFASSSDRVPVVAGYALPIRTYVAPREEKNTQKIYDLDQAEEAPVVEKILPYQDVPESTPSNTPPPKDSAPGNAAKPEHSPPAESSDPKQLPASKPPETPKFSTKDVKEALQTERSVLEEKKPNPLHKDTLDRPAKPSLALKKRVQIGPVFSDLQRAKSFLVRLRAKAEGYRFTLQSRAIHEKPMYRIITQEALTPAQVKELNGMVPVLSEKL